MTIFRLGDQAPPPPQRITDDVVMRFEHVYEVDPDLMQVTPQQDMPDSARAAILKAIDAVPANRFASAEAFARALE